MIECKKIFIDTAPFIYYIEKDENNPCYFDKMKHFLENCYHNDIKIITSAITIEEYYVFPYRNNRMDYVSMFEKLIKTLRIQVIPINESVAKKAAEIRAKYKYFKAMDALQLSVACLENCELFLTNDKQIKQL